MTVVVVYELDGLKGGYLPLKYGRYTNKQLKGLQDVRSLEIGPKVAIILYQEDYFKGKEFVLFNDSEASKIVTDISLQAIPCNTKSIIVDCSCKRKKVKNTLYNNDVICKDKQRIVYSTVKPDYQKTRKRKSTFDKPVMIIHGFGYSKLSWFCIQNQLVEHFYESTVVDLRAHGNSAGFKDQSMLFEDMLEDLRIVANHLGYFDEHKKMIVIGHDIGGIIAQLWALKYTNEVDKLILIDSAPLGSVPDFYTKMAKCLIKQWTASCKPIPLEVFVCEYTGLTFNEETSDDCSLHKLKEDLMDGFRKCNECALKKIFTDNSFHSINDEKLKRLKTPTLILHGSQDEVVCTNGSEELSKLIPFSKYITINCKGHSPQFTESHGTFVYILNFIRQDKCCYDK